MLFLSDLRLQCFSNESGSHKKTAPFHVSNNIFLITITLVYILEFLLKGAIFGV